MAELLTNPGFETGNTTGWTTTGSPTVGTSSPRSGSYSTQVTADSYTLYQDVDLTAYASSIDSGLVDATMFVWGKNGGIGEGDTLRVRLQYLNVSDTILAENDTGNVAGNASYTQYTDTRTCPATTRKLRVYLYGNEGGTSNADIYFDDASATIVVRQAGGAFLLNMI